MPEINSVAGQLVGIPVGQVYTAGKGINIDNVHKTVSVDETVLWEGTLNTLNSDVSCSESIYNFDRIKVFYRIVSYSTVQSVAVHEFEPSEISSTSFVSFGSFYLISNGWYGWWLCRLSVTDNNKIKITKTLNSFGNGASPAGYTVDTSNTGFIYKIVGVNRISGGN